MLALVSSPLDLKENERLQIEKEQEILLQAVEFCPKATKARNAEIRF